MYVCMHPLTCHALSKIARTRDRGRLAQGVFFDGHQVRQRLFWRWRKKNALGVCIFFSRAPRAGHKPSGTYTCILICMYECMNINSIRKREREKERERERETEVRAQAVRHLYMRVLHIFIYIYIYV